MNCETNRVTWAVMAVCSLLLSTGLVHAASSNVNGVVKGVVVDENGNGIADVSVSLSDASVGLTRSVTTGAGGNFQIQLPIGQYRLETFRAGYRSVTIDDVRVELGEVASLRIESMAGALEEIITYGTVASKIQAATAETSLSLSLEDVAMIPVARNIESVALLAPGTIRGDVQFGEDKSLVSFGGASVAENAYYIDGMNVTNFRNGLGGSTVPFEFYDQFQIKTGAYSAEFGRSTGGVINAVTKRGSNEFNYGVVGYLAPDFFRGTSPNTLYASGELYDLNEDNEAMSWTTDVYVSGPIIRDRLFFYALYEFRDRTSDFTSRGAVNTLNEQEIDDDFWGGNLLWHITDDHSLSATVFTDKRSIFTQQFDYDADAGRKGERGGSSTLFRGGETSIYRYEGQITDRLFVSALYGRNEYDLTDTSDVSEQCPLVVNLLEGGLGGNTTVLPGCWVAVRLNSGADEREAYRFDVEWVIGDHLLRFGIDHETNTSTAFSTYPGTNFRDTPGLGVYYRYETAPVGSQLANGAIVPDVNGDGSDVDYVRWRISDVSGEFETNTSAWYIEDEWSITDNFTVSLGLRNETFDNGNGIGLTFIEIEDQLAPRIGMSWDAGGTGDRRIHASWGRYHLPVANNTNVRLSGAEEGRQRYFVFDGLFDPVSAAPLSLGADGVPTTLELGTELVTANGVTPDSAQLADKNIEPMYQDEYIIGIEQVLANEWVVGARYINRELASGIDDVLIYPAVDALGYEHTGDAGGYVLTNPGGSVTIPYDRFDTGVLEETTFPADLLGYPRAKRTYEAIELTAAREFDGEWGLRGSYTYSRSEGNTEGYVKSDTGQDDAGITQDFDFPQLMDGSFGYLPNDRRHKLKLYGNYQLTERLLLGANLFMQSGRPRNNFGIDHPDGRPGYGDTFYITDPITGELRQVPRGSVGRTPWIVQLDLSAIYSFEIGNRGQVQLRAEVFNVFDADNAIEVFEFGETAPGRTDARFGLPTSYQAPRSLRFGASIRF